MSPAEHQFLSEVLHSRASSAASNGGGLFPDGLDGTTISLFPGKGHGGRTNNSGGGGGGGGGGSGAAHNNSTSSHHQQHWSNINHAALKSGNNNMHQTRTTSSGYGNNNGNSGYGNSGYGNSGGTKKPTQAARAMMKDVRYVLKHRRITDLDFFRTLDSDASGKITPGEFMKGLATLGFDFTTAKGVRAERAARQLYAYLDKDGDGHITWAELHGGHPAQTHDDWKITTSTNSFTKGRHGLFFPVDFTGMQVRGKRQTPMVYSHS